MSRSSSTPAPWWTHAQQTLSRMPPIMTTSSSVPARPGCVVARRLMEDGEARVLLLEAGGADIARETIINPSRWVENIGSANDGGYQYAPAAEVNQRTTPMPRGKILGGSGSINALVWARGHRADYDGWAAAGNAGWDFASVLPLFRRCETWEDGASEFRGGDGPVRVERVKDPHPAIQALIDAGRSFGMPYLDDHNVPEPEGVRAGESHHPQWPALQHRRRLPDPGPGGEESRRADRRDGAEADLRGPALHRRRVCDRQRGSCGARLARSHPVCWRDRHAAAAHALRHRSCGGAATPRHCHRGRPARRRAKSAGPCHDLRHLFRGEGNVARPSGHNLSGSIALWKSRASLDRPDISYVGTQFALRHARACPALPGSGRKRLHASAGPDASAKPRLRQNENGPARWPAGNPAEFPARASRRRGLGRRGRDRIRTGRPARLS